MAPFLLNSISVDFIVFLAHFASVQFRSILSFFWPLLFFIGIRWILSFFGIFWPPYNFPSILWFLAILASKGKAKSSQKNDKIKGNPTEAEIGQKNETNGNATEAKMYQKYIKVKDIHFWPSLELCRFYRFLAPFHLHCISVDFIVFWHLLACVGFLLILLFFGTISPP